MSNVGESTEFPLDNVEEKIQKLKEDENVRVDISCVLHTHLPIMSLRRAHGVLPSFSHYEMHKKPPAFLNSTVKSDQCRPGKMVRQVITEMHFLTSEGLMGS